MAIWKTQAPWTDEQVEQLNKWQMTDHVHPFTCGGPPECRYLDPDSYRGLTATPDGWVCPCGNYTQDWAYGYMIAAEGFDGPRMTDDGHLLYGGPDDV